MPNWCENELYITGDKAELDKFIQQAKNSPEVVEKRKQEYDILQNLYPCPEELINTVSGFLSGDEQIALEKKQVENLANYGYKDWYDWCCAKWGTKWGDADTYLQEYGDNRIGFIFNSAWGPPIDGISHIAQMFPNLKFALSYHEDGMGFYGLSTFEADGDVLDSCYEYTDIEGYNDIPDGETEEENFDAWDKRQELVDNARTQLLLDADV